MRIAFSFASAPPLVKNTFAKPSGAFARMRCAASPRARFAVAGPMVASVPACSWIAVTTAGCWCPMFTLTSWLEKSSMRLPSKSQTVAADPPAITGRSRFACASQEWKT